ncbi:MAG: MotA/TolQ/ExbB proton channel family protein [Deltaproteobacteria bacterium]|nr:MotA/TolQ/ExbB proton channel family protein [Deltaproteobacteria bacterium]
MLTEKLLEWSLIGAEWVLWLLVGLSLLSVGLVLDRLLLFSRTRERLGELEPRLIDALLRCDLEDVRQLLGRDSFVRNVLRAGVELIEKRVLDPGSVEQAMMGALARERARYEARLTPLGTIGANAPFIGLFGTVLGIIQAFHQMGQMGSGATQGSNEMVMAAIGEALIATAVGILVAIPAVAAFNWAKASIGSRVKNAESLMRAVLSGLGRFECVEPEAALESEG